MRRMAMWTAAAALGIGLSCAVAANPVQTEIATALVHANVAQQLDTVAGVHLHLHHVLNCVLGPASKRYDAAAEAVSANPCKGAGAVPEASPAPAVRTDLERAAQAAEQGIAAQTLAASHAQARATITALKAAQHAAR